MSCCEGTSGGLERYPGTGCCGTSCAAGKTGCSASEPRIRSCFCQENVGCLDRADCGGFRPRGTAATGACPGPCQCAEEEAWNRNVPPKPNCEWLSNFSELRRQWSDHGRQSNCKCCNCKPCRTAAPCRPCLTPPPTCSTANFARDDCQSCCADRLSGGASVERTEPKSPSAPSNHRDRLAAGGCQSLNLASAPQSSTMYGCSPPPISPPSEHSIRAPWPGCRPPNSCQPCAASPRAAPQQRSCCQCVSGRCMCQPMPRECNCPPPVQVDARAERDCSCDCPSSPECACPPSERRFSRAKVKCPNARLCCPTPRAQPGPKCSCTECQPCLPPPCDPCTANKCRTTPPRVKPCCGASSSDESDARRPEPPRIKSCCGASSSDESDARRPCAPPEPPPSCPDCSKMAAARRAPAQSCGAPAQNCRAPAQNCRAPAQTCRAPAQTCSPGPISRPASGRLVRALNRSRSPEPRRLNAAAGRYRSPGQSRTRVDPQHSNNDERARTVPDEGLGDDDDDNGEADPGRREAQCHCGPRPTGRDEECESCCARHLDGRREDNEDNDNDNKWQCNCGDAVGCAEECGHCCAAGCDVADATPGNIGERDLGRDLQSDLDLGRDLEPDFGSDLGRDLEPDFESDLGRDLERDLERDFGSDLGRDLGRDLEPDFGSDLGRDLDLQFDLGPDLDFEPDLCGGQCCCGADGTACAESCDYCCSRNCDAEPPYLEDNEGSRSYATGERIAAGGTDWIDAVRDNDNKRANESRCGVENRVELRVDGIDVFSENVSASSTSKCGSWSPGCPSLESTPEVPDLEALSRHGSDCVADDRRVDGTGGNDVKKGGCDGASCSTVAEVPAATGRPSSTCKVLRCLRRKSPVGH